MHSPARCESTRPHFDLLSAVTDVRYFAACYPAMLKNFAAREHSPFASVACAGMLARALGMINRGAAYVRAEVL